MVDSLITSSFVAVAVIGLVHGFEPGHGWPVAALLSIKRERPIVYGLASSSILSAAHFLSSAAVLLLYYLAATFVDFSSPYFRYVVAAILIVIALRLLSSRPKGSQDVKGRGVISLKGLAALALLLGFAHEEEFMLLALAVGGVNPLLLIAVYTSAVTVSLISVTLVSIKAYAIVEGRMKRYERHMPKITALILLLLATLFLLGVY
ncbi:MAG: hypothetical protein FJZ49_06775 [Candidatus Verstraetearchaeota archaeon]|nr:hypothetical protein [Candidatus Verstraetearchaeota archaeon]